MQGFQVYYQDGINMTKVKCYSNIPGGIYLILLILSIVAGVIPFIIFRDDENEIFKIIWIIVFTLSAMFSIWGIVYHRQYLIVIGNKLILRNPLYTIKELIIDDCYYEITKLPSYICGRYYYDQWICIYSINEINKFKYGYSNSKRFMRLHVICNEKNLEFIDCLLKKEQ